MTRDSVRKYCQIQPYSTSYNNMANIFAHSFTTPYNSVLALNGYQEANDTPTKAAMKVTTDVCSQLKVKYKDDLKIYIIKYRKQNKYKTFPFDGVTHKDLDHDYNYLNECASGTSAPYLYDISTKTELENALTAIAKDIKENFAKYTDAKVFNVAQ